MESNIRTTTLQHIIEVAQLDPRIVGAVDYGSTSQGRGDAYSDIDVALFIVDEAFDAFKASWTEWVTQFGDVLLAYIGGVGHPWVVFNCEHGLPLRVDFNFICAADHSIIRTWPNAPVSVASMLLYDNLNGALEKDVARLIGQSLAPSDPQEAFETICGDFWYYLLRTHTHQLRGAYWSARHDFNFIIVGNLMALLRFEAGKVNRFRGANASVALEQEIAATRLHQLNAAAIPEADEQGVARALNQTAQLGYDVCCQIEQAYGWSWPTKLADRVVALLA